MSACIVCGKPLVGRQRTLCSDECRRMRRKERNHKWRQNNLEKRKEYDRKYHQNNQEKRNEYGCEYRRKNSEKIKEQRHGYYQNNRETIIKSSCEYYQNNQEKKKEYDCEYRLNNRDGIKEQQQEYRQNNQEKIKMRKRKEYRRGRGLPEDCDLFKESSIEVIMKRWLQESDIEFVQQYHISFENSTYTRVDFYIPEANVCLYVDGDYWHGPEYPDAQERDMRNNKILEAMGYSVARMTEAEILEGNRPWWIGELISTKW